MEKIILTEEDKLFIQKIHQIENLRKQIDVIKNEKEALLIEKDSEKEIIESEKDTLIQGIQTKIDKLKE